MKDHPRILAYLADQPWAITPDWLETLIAIAAGWGPDHQALQVREGRPLRPDRSVILRDDVAIIPVVGPLFPRANLLTEFSGAVSVEELLRDIAAATDNPAVRASVLHLDSPGGVVTAIAEGAEFIREASRVKPIVAHVDGMGASGAYWLAAAASRITLAPTAAAGSIGVVATYRLNRDDRTVEIVSSGAPGKRPDLSTDAGRAQIQATVDRLEAVFVEAVARYRNVTVDTVRADFGKGGVKIGRDAVEAGMADAVSTLETVIAGLSGSTVGVAMSSTAKGAGDQPALTLDTLKTHHADLVQAIAADAAKTARAEGVAAERARIRAILGGEHAKGRETLAQVLAFEGDLAPEAAERILQAAPLAAAATPAAATKPVTPFEQVMATIKNPDVTPSTADDDEDIDAWAKRVAGYARL